MYVCMCMYVYIYIYVRVCLCMDTYTYVRNTYVLNYPTKASPHCGCGSSLQMENPCDDWDVHPRNHKWYTELSAIWDQVRVFRICAVMHISLRLHFNPGPRLQTYNINQEISIHAESAIPKYTLIIINGNISAKNPPCHPYLKRHSMEFPTSSCIFPSFSHLFSVKRGVTILQVVPWLLRSPVRSVTVTTGLRPKTATAPLFPLNICLFMGK